MMSNRNHRPPTAKFREGTQPGIVLNQSAVTLLREDGANYVGVIFDDKRLKIYPIIVQEGTLQIAKIIQPSLHCGSPRIHLRKESQAAVRKETVPIGKRINLKWNDMDGCLEGNFPKPDEEESDVDD